MGSNAYNTCILACSHPVDTNTPKQKQHYYREHSSQNECFLFHFPSGATPKKSCTKTWKISEGQLQSTRWCLNKSCLDSDVLLLYVYHFWSNEIHHELKELRPYHEVVDPRLAWMPQVYDYTKYTINTITRQSKYTVRCTTGNRVLTVILVSVFLAMGFQCKNGVQTIIYLQASDVPVCM